MPQIEAESAIGHRPSGLCHPPVPLTAIWTKVQKADKMTGQTHGVKNRERGRIMVDSERGRAKRVILEIIKRSGGELAGATKLHKMFYWAHRYYSELAPGYLSEWPIVRMPNGPGIDASRSLLGELVMDGLLEVGHASGEPFTPTTYRLTDGLIPGEPLDEIALQAIGMAVDHILPMTATQASEEAHRESRSWRSAWDGCPINIYIDHIPEEEYRTRRQELHELKDRIAAAFADEES
jgi:hypothetical protein